MQECFNFVLSEQATLQFRLSIHFEQNNAYDYLIDNPL
jgi:hypothetical protein